MRFGVSDKMGHPGRKTLATLILLYGVASLLHFVHNAEYLADYPNLPASWTRADVYIAWLAMTTFGLSGWLLLIRGYPRTRLALLVVYSAVGLESLGHYLRAGMHAHTLAMNVSILAEVTAAPPCWCT